MASLYSLASPRTLPGAPARPAQRGYHALYREHEVNHCPGCGRSQWLVGRTLAECSFCATALPLAESVATGAFARIHTAHGLAPSPASFAG